MRICNSGEGVESGEIGEGGVLELWRCSGRRASPGVVVVAKAVPAHLESLSGTLSVEVRSGLEAKTVGVLFRAAVRRRVSWQHLPILPLFLL